MKTRFLITGANDLVYADNKAAAGTDTALSPYDLEIGNIGIYGVHRAGSTNLNKMVLITDGGGEAAGRVQAASFVGEQIYIALGVADGAIISGALDVGKITCNSQAYVAGTKQVVNIGYTSNYTTGLLNETDAILKGDEAMLKVSNPLDITTMNQAPVSYSGYATNDAATMYSILADIVKSVYEDENRIIDVAIHTNLTGTTDIGGTSSTFVHGSTVVVHTGTDHLLDAGDYVEISGDTYIVAVDGGAGGYTLDRPYRGASATIVVANIHDQGATAPTEVGLVVTDKTIGVKAEISLGGLIESATKYVSTAFVPSINSGTEIYKGEKENRSLLGAHDVTDRRVPIKDLNTDITKNYDTYLLSAVNTRGTSDPHNSSGQTFSAAEVLVGFENDTADSGNTHQSDFEDILASLNVTVRTLF